MTTIWIGLLLLTIVAAIVTVSVLVLSRSREVTKERLTRSLDAIHETLKTTEVTDIKLEAPEQLMALQYLPRDARVLELGANIGRNSLLIARLLQNETNFVSVETIEASVNELRENRKLNGMNFHIVHGALSYRPLHQDPDSRISEPGDGNIPIYSLDQIESEHDLNFNVLIAGCEGCVAHILEDNPELFAKIDTVFMEHDETCNEDFRVVRSALSRTGLKQRFRSALPRHPVKEAGPHFYSVYSRTPLLDQTL